MPHGEIDYRVIDRSGSGEPLPRDVRHVWTAAGLLWCAANLAAIAVGLFPQLVSAGPDFGAAPPVLRALTVGQVGFALVVYPLLLIHRGKRPVWRDGVELALWLAMAAPFVVVAAYMSDAAAPDVVRAAAMAVASLATGWCLGRFALTAPSAAHLAILIGLALVLAGPMTVYIVWEFGGGSEPPTWLMHGCPVTFAWLAAASRQAGWAPAPASAWLLWPVVAAAMVGGARLRQGGEKDGVL